jgi:hypothetical protein
LGALNALSNGKSCGLERVPAECYRYAQRVPQPDDEEKRTINMLAPVLLDLFEHIRVTSEFPAQFCVSALSPLFKKGDAQDKDNYRGLAVGGALGKCYAMLLDKRLVRFGESSEVRCPFQAGSRKGRSTVHNLFVVRHLKAKHELIRVGERAGDYGTNQHPPLFVCQIDF